MPHFIAIKIHFDHRNDLPPHLKYSRPATAAEHAEYLARYNQQGLGGNGFHECLNFRMPESGPVRIYLPPTCIPGIHRLNDEFVIFSFTYQQDPDMPPAIVGVHGRARIFGREGRPRTDAPNIPGIGRISFHAEAQAEYSTLFLPPVIYNREDERHTPPNFKHSLMNLDQGDYAQHILQDAYDGAMAALQDAVGPARFVIERELRVLQNIAAYHGLELIQQPNEPGHRAEERGGEIPAPDQEIGLLGEQVIFDREVENARLLGLGPGAVEWVSQAAPQCPYDIKTVRRNGVGYADHYLEVKTTKAEDGPNVYISSGQLAFLKDHERSSSVVIVRFNAQEQEPEIRDLQLHELLGEFDLIPIKYKLHRRG